MKLIKKIFLYFTIIFIPNIYAENNEKVLIKYKKYESFDLGNLEIQGKLIAPGDLSIKERQRKRFSRPLFERDHFDPEVREDIQNLR